MRLFRILGILIAFAGIGAWLLLTGMSYNDLIFVIADIVNVTGKEEKLKAFITLNNFGIIKSTPLLLVPVGIIIYRQADKVRLLFRRVGNWVINVSNDIKSIPSNYLIAITFITLIAFCIRLFYVIKMPISYDEAWTYLNFTRRGFFASLSYYPAPNNHIFHSILTNITFYLPFTQTINLRLPNLLISSLSVVVFYFSFRKHFKDGLALSLTIVYASLFPLIYYGYCSRGYSVILPAFIICFHGAVQIIKKHEDGNLQKYMTYMTLGAIVGVYTMPSFLYPCFAITSFLVAFFIYNKDHAHLLRLIAHSFIAIIIILGLYTPVFMVSGVDAVINNNFVKPISRLEVFHQLLPHFVETMTFLFTSKIAFVSIIVASIIFLIKKHNIAHALFSFYIIILCPIILLLHAVIPFPRTWIYLIVPVLFLAALLFKVINIGHVPTIAISLFLSMLLLFSFHKRINDYEKFSFEAQNLAQFFIENSPNKIYCNHPLVETNLIYTFDERDANIQVIYSRKSPSRDSLITNSTCDYLVMEKNNHQFENYTLYEKFGANLFVYSKTRK